MQHLLIAHVFGKSPLSKQGHDFIHIKVGERCFGFFEGCHYYLEAFGWSPLGCQLTSSCLGISYEYFLSAGGVTLFTVGSQEFVKGTGVNKI